MLPAPEEKALEITAGHWAYLAGLASIVIAMALRKNDQRGTVWTIRVG
jgi:hypothetical protein